MAEKAVPAHVINRDGEVEQVKVDANDNTKNDLNKAPADNPSQRGKVDHWGVTEKRVDTSPHFPEDNPSGSVLYSPEERAKLDKVHRAHELSKQENPGDEYSKPGDENAKSKIEIGNAEKHKTLGVDPEEVEKLKKQNQEKENKHSHTKHTTKDTTKENKEEVK